MKALRERIDYGEEMAADHGAPILPEISKKTLPSALRKRMRKVGFDAFFFLQRLMEVNTKISVKGEKFYPLRFFHSKKFRLFWVARVRATS